MNRNGLKIGEFSRLCRVTVRALSVRTPVAAMGKDFDIIGKALIPVDGYVQNVPQSHRTYLSEPDQAPYGKNK